MTTALATRRHPGRRLAVAASAVLLVGLVAPGAPAAPAERSSSAAPAAGGRTQPGPTGGAIVVEDIDQLAGFDLDTDAGGTSYLGWISAAADHLRKVHLCVLPKRATACSGGVRTIALTAESASTSSGLQVIATGVGAATLVWFHDTVASQSGPSGGRLATATYSGGVLSGPVDVGVAPSYGSLFDVADDTTGALWAVVSDGVVQPGLQVRQGLSGTPTPLTAPWGVGHAWLAFAGSTPIVAVDRYGSISEPIRYTRKTTSWSPFAKVPNTWNVGQAGMVGTRRGVRLIASEGNPGYRPVVSVFANGAFGTGKLIGDRSSCAPSSHDLVTDVSGRVADVGNECGKITVANLANTTRAGLVRFSAGGTVAGQDPQITTMGRGDGWVAFGVLSTTGIKLKAVPVMLPALTTKKGKTGAAGKVTVRGPASCLPAVQAPVGVGAKPASGWKVKSKSLKLDGNAVSGSSINGAGLAAGSAHTLTGIAKFSRPGHSTATVKVNLSFTACPNG